MKAEDFQSSPYAFIKEVLPHRPPFLFIDEIVEYQPKKRVVALKSITGDEFFFQGHFPKNPIMPGVLIIEAVAQASIFLFGRTKSTGNLLYLLTSIKSRFFKPVYPGNQLRIEVTPLKLIDNAAIVKGNVYVNGAKVSTSELSIAVRKANA